MTLLLDLGMVVSARQYRRLQRPGARRWLASALDHESRLGVRKLVLTPQTLVSGTPPLPALRATPDGWGQYPVDPPPRVLYNLIARPALPEAWALRRLVESPRAVLFNETNRWDHGMVHSILSTFPETCEYLTQTVTLSASGPTPLPPGTYVLVPRLGPDRRRLVLLDLDGQDGTASVSSSGCCWALSLPGHPVGPEGPVEWRVYVHRDGSGGWVATAGIAKRELLCAGREPRSWPLEEAAGKTLGNKGPAFLCGLWTAARAIPGALSRYVPGIAHLALDFWVDCDGRLMLAGLVGAYRTDWLRDAGDLEGFRAVTDHPSKFALLLAEKGVSRIDVDFGRH